MVPVNMSLALCSALFLKKNNMHDFVSNKSFSQ